MTAEKERFEALSEANYGDILAYAARRCRSREDAEDVVAETFAVTWTRIGEVPTGREGRLWLFGTARLVQANQHRGHRRRAGLFERIRRATGPAEGHVEADLAERERIEEALARLNSTDREILLLNVWDGLSAADIAVALEINVAAVWKRLQRARERLACALDEAPARKRPTPPKAIAMFATTEPARETSR